VRKPHEHPSIGVLLCASKNDEVVEYALSRTLSAALIPRTRRNYPTKGSSRPNSTSFTSERARRAWKATTRDRETPHAEKGSVDHSEPNRIEFDRRRLNALIIWFLRAIWRSLCGDTWRSGHVVHSVANRCHTRLLPLRSPSDSMVEVA
jgi:hypothetical protein